MNDETRQLVRVATLYYTHQLLQSEIAERVGVSRQTVGRLLQRANDLGLVKVEIQQPFAYITDLELQLEQTFGLAEAVVVSPLDDDEDTIKSALGNAATAFIQRKLKDGDILGLSSGSTTLYQCAVQMKPAHLPNVTVVSLNGNAPPSVNKPNVDLTAMLIGQALGARTVLLPAPMFVDNASIKASLMNDFSIAAVIRLGQAANLVLLGIGLVSEFSTPFRQGYFGKDLLELIRQRGAVGEIVCHAYDSNGVCCFPEISDRAIAIDLESLHKKEFAVAVAGGAAKVEAIWGGIQGRYFNVLITDTSAARGLLNLAEKRKTATTGSADAVDSAST